MSRAVRRALALLALHLVLAAGPAQALRPYWFTDADVVEPGVLEPEVGLVTLTAGDEGRAWTVPGLVLNLGLVEHLELVVESELTLAEPGPEAHMGRVGTFLKAVLLAGSFQRAVPWPSVALEAGAAWPTTGADGVEVAALLILSWQIGPLALHLNGEFFGDGFGTDAGTVTGSAGGAIGELELGGGLALAAELTVEGVRGEPVSGTALMGIVYELTSPEIKLDLAGRIWLGGAVERWAVTAGLTFELRLWHRESHS